MIYAQPSERIKDAFNTMDTNGDGNTSFPEFQDNGKNPVVRFDANGDNLVSLEEFLNGRPKVVRNGRGRISEGRPRLKKDKVGEFATKVKERAIAKFKELDLDGDGYLSADEVPASRSRGLIRGLGRNRRGPPPLTEEQLAEIKANVRQIVSDRFADIDLDGEQLMLDVEFREASFLQLDKDGNGVLSLDELKPRPRDNRGLG